MINMQSAGKSFKNLGSCWYLHFLDEDTKAED